MNFSLKIVSWKTLIGGLIASLPAFIDWTITVVPPKYQGLASAIGVLIIGLNAKDRDVTGGTKPQ